MPSVPPAIPGPILESVRQVLAQRGDTTALRSVQRALGGFESTSVRLTTRRCSYFLKWNPSPAHGGFRAEADNLALLAATGAVCVPEVLAACDPDAAGAPGFLLQEWLTPPSRDAFARRVGRELGPAIAALHRARTVGEMRIAGYGPATAMTGRAQEPWQADWVTFYRDGLVRPALRALGTVRGPQDHLLVMDPPVSLQAGDLRLQRLPRLRQAHYNDPCKNQPFDETQGQRSPIL